LIPPAASAYVYVRDRAALENLLERIISAEAVAVDTEADSLHNYFEKICLIQLSFEGEHYLVDPLAELDFSDFLQALAEKPLILHGADYDLRMLRASLGFRPRRQVFDTMIAAQLLGIEQIGLAALIEKFLNIKIGKEGQKSDWSRRPLSEKQLSYAANDTRFLGALAECLQTQLSERGRTQWHAESCQAMVLATGREHMRDPEDAWRIKGSGRMSRRQLAYLREIWRWRDEQARRANVPAFKIFVNDQMLELASWAESHCGAALQQGPKLPRNINGARLRTLEEAIGRAGAIPSGARPEIKSTVRDQSNRLDCKESIERLRGECARIAKILQIAASTLAPRAALEAIARKRPRTVEEIMASGGLLHWQSELIEEAVGKVLYPELSRTRRFAPQNESC
jgi:ribonuclease D